MAQSAPGVDAVSARWLPPWDIPALALVSCCSEPRLAGSAIVALHREFAYAGPDP